MMDFIYNLYGTDHFVLYLTIALVVLVILFFIILFFGKKDQKLEETKKLQKIELEKNNNEDIKEENIEPVIEPEVEKPILTEEKEEKINEPIQEIEEKKEEIKESIDEVKVTIFEPSKEIMKVNQTDVDLADDIPIDYSEITQSLEKGLSELESIKNEFNSINVPSIEEKEEVKEELGNEKPFQPSQVFSSVFVNNEERKENVETKKEVEPTISIVDEPTIVVEEIPTISVVEEPVDVNVPLDDFDLPELKPEQPKNEQSKPTLNSEVTPNIETPKEGTTFSFDDMINETYNLK